MLVPIWSAKSKKIYQKTTPVIQLSLLILYFIAVVN